MRKCVNPECLRVCKDDHETICTNCGWGTREHVEKKEKVDGDRPKHRDRPAGDDRSS